jgi:hypothetical protein
VSRTGAGRTLGLPDVAIATGIPADGRCRFMHRRRQVPGCAMHTNDVRQRALQIRGGASVANRLSSLCRMAQTGCVSRIV